MKNPKTIENYLRRKMRLEALLAVVQRKGELVKIIRTAPNLKKAEENLISHFSLTSEQVQYLLNAEVRFLMGSEYEDVQKKYNQVVAYLTKHNNDTSIMSKDYTKGRWAHLAKYAVEKGLRCGGLYKGRAYCHILFTENKEQKKEVIKKILLKGVKADMLANPHTDAHHLNSSQILCYNFFRPLITNDGKATAELVSLLGKYGIAITNNATCQFEYTDKIKDRTQFDFYIKEGEIEVFFEIKYTENCFGGPSSSDSAKRQYKNWYEEQFKQQQCLKEIPANTDDFIANYTHYYQLYRNTIRITDKNKHLILLYPKNNTTVNKEATTFIEDKIKEKYRGNIHILHWEDIVKEGELYEKYFAE